MDKSQSMKLVTAIAETVLGIPIFGGLLIVGSFWSLLPIMLVLHIISLIFAEQVGRKKAGNIVGIVGSLLGWIPVVGFLFHVAASIVLWIEFVNENK